MTKCVNVVVFVFVLLAACECPGDDWPQFRGRNRDGRSAEKDLLKEWPEGGPELLWSIEGLGGGFSSVAVADGYVYTTGLVGKDKQGVLWAYGVDGSPKWNASYGPEWKGSHPGTRTTPTVDGGRAYVISGYGNLACFDAKTGGPKWQVDVLKRFNGKNINWGISESVLIFDDKVICTPGGKDACVVALNKISAQTIWTSKGLSDESAYCSPILVDAGGRKMVITITARQIVGIDAQTGEVLWRQENRPHKGKPRRINPNSPVYHDNALYLTSRFVGGVKLKISEDGTKVSELWANEQLDPHHGGVVLVDGYIHGTDSRDEKWMCLDWESGKVKYADKLVGKGSLMYADGMLYCYGQDGKLALVRPAGTGYETVSSFEIRKGAGSHWGHPAISNGRLYIRHGDALMVYDIRQRHGQ
ncbi:MAG: outer membrane protein assembly factor BamB family protein [Planctomycetota bacterium]|jgi:outer membrane protein assembly factor BamB